MAPQSILCSKVLAVAALGLAPLAASAQLPASPTLDSLLNTRVTAASKYEQRASSAAASVTILSSDDIRLHGFRTLQEALESVRGLYVSNDRNYPYLGVRGFSRPTDYNNRVLLLVDGHAINEQIWGSVPVGSDLPLNLESVERIEVVRGPGSALYGSNAMFAVINVVTKTGAQLDGTKLTVRGGSGSLREIGVATGHTIGADGSASFAGQLSTTDGSSLYFAEYDSPATNNGVVRALDWENGASALGTLQWRGYSARVGFRSRTKGIPTGAYSSVFGDSRAETFDGTGWVEVAKRSSLGPALTLNTRAFGDVYRYTGTYPGDSGPAFGDRAENVALGAEAIVIWDPVSHDRLSVGVEGKRNVRASYTELFADGTSNVTDSRFTAVSAYVQNEFDISSTAVLVTGARLDARSREAGALSPRVGLILTPDQSTVAKLLFGDAFRAPSPAEKDFRTGWYRPNPELRPERIRATEVEIERRLSSALSVIVSMYDYHVDDLIDQVADSTGIVFLNMARARTRGLEGQGVLAPSWSPFVARGTYAILKATDDRTNAVLTNSPTRIATLSVTPRTTARFRQALDVRHESGRGTLTGPPTSAFTKADINLAYATGRYAAFAARGAEVSLRINNVFDTPYAFPAGIEHRQAAIPQDGRTATLRIDWRF